MIQINHLTKSFGSAIVLNDVSLTWESGMIHGLVGQNGSGKTVLLKCICGLMRYDAGEILINDKQVGKDIEMPPDLGVIIENPGFIQRMTGYNNLKILAEIRKKISDDRIRETMTLVGLDWKSRKPVSHYSLGMKQRLGIAQAIMENPSLLIFDEPFNGLDKNGTKEIQKLFRELMQTGKTIILVSHNPLDISEMCNTVVEIDAGIIRKRS